MLLFWKLVDETQMGNSRDNTVRDISSKFSIFLPLRAIYFRSYQYETPCRLCSKWKENHVIRRILLGSYYETIMLHAWFLITIGIIGRAVQKWKLTVWYSFFEQYVL